MEDVSLTYTGFLTRGDKRIIKVRFSRNNDRDYAEGTLPGGEIDKSEGFSKEELAGLHFYLKANEKDLVGKAREISGIRGFMR